MWKCSNSSQCRQFSVTFVFVIRRVKYDQFANMKNKLTLVNF